MSFFRTGRLFLSLAVVFLFLFALSSNPPAAAQSAGEAAAAPGVRKVFDFLKSCPNYFLATVEGDQPRVRPFGSLAVFEGKIYFQTGRVKNVSRQLLANGKIEICALGADGAWIRVQALAVEDDRLEAKQFLLDAHPELKSMYQADDGNTQVFYLQDVTATLESFSGGGWQEKF
jgi:uncharacterized pyridoxamine 5'-phosphate oxidase family protein